MALVPSDAPLASITIPEAIDAVLKLTREVMRKNKTMIDYYIYPDSTPSEIDAYRPRLNIIHGRFEQLATIEVSKLMHLVDEAEIVMSEALIPGVQQLMRSVNGFEQIFIDHYNRDLEEKRPYDKIFGELSHRLKQLIQLRDEKIPAQSRRADTLAPPPSNTELTFCRNAVAFVNLHDEGKLSQVMSEDLLPDQRERLRSHGGAYLWWECSECAFKIRYHITNSRASGIDQTDDIRSHVETPGIEYRVSWLVKCHLFLPASRNNRCPSVSDRRESESRRRNSAVGRRDSIFRDRQGNRGFFINPPRRSAGNVTQQKKDEPKSAEPDPDKYGCPFCYAIGKDLVTGYTAFGNGRDLARHIASRHRQDRSPPQLVLLEKYAVAVNNVMSSTAESPRWDLNLK